jgi:photosystem II Psb27 protein
VPLAAPSRRQLGLAALAAAAAALAPPPARAFGGPDAAEKYTVESAALIVDLTAALAMDAGTAREETMGALRPRMSAWVAQYRRDKSFSGRPSYSNLYSAVNALAGQLNSFGPGAKVPAKRLERLTKELADADKALQRGR